MSMIANFAELTSAQLKDILVDSGSLSGFLYSEDSKRSVAYEKVGIHLLFTGEVARLL
jgi:hypothetical protein